GARCYRVQRLCDITPSNSALNAKRAGVGKQRPPLAVDRPGRTALVAGWGRQAPLPVFGFNLG
ncbi:MAG TPA: hypothetical protein VLL25_05800, partial [Acidimicrobiales bacterium]|nr:hypothetical protein [Acidimicrobiales bacterium]